MSTPRLAYTVAAAADATGFSRQSIIRAIARGDLRAKRTLADDPKTGKPRGEFRILAGELERWLKALTDA